MSQISLTIAGSDCSSGAGIQADLKTFSTLGVHGLTAITSVVAETPHKVDSVFALPPEEVLKQIRCLTNIYPIGSIKTGMLHSKETAEAIVGEIKSTPLSVAHLVVDPVLSASTGDRLSQKEIISAYKDFLFPAATIITPNIPEAEAFLDTSLESPKEFVAAAKELAAQYGVACLLKGGHSEGEECVDYLATGDQLREFSAKRIPVPMSHGTGCTLSAAIAANLAKGQMLPTAVGNAKSWLHRALANSLHWRVNGIETYCINQAEF